MTDIISSELFDLGCLGIVEGISDENSVSLRVCFENIEPEKRAAIEVAISRVLAGDHSGVIPVTTGNALGNRHSPPLRFIWEDVPYQNWKETHRRFYPAQELTSRFFLVPAWQSADIIVPAGYLPILMEPGRAFGTGLHQSTKLALWLMEEYLVADALPFFHRVLDVGTGSGILAIAAHKLGSKEVVGTDIDPDAVEVAFQNAMLNGCESVCFSSKSLQDFPVQHFHLVVSNILLRTHAELLPGYAHTVAPGGVLILSGLLVDQVAAIEPSLRGQGFMRNRSKVIDEWEAVAYVRRAPLTPE